jgi:CRP/FNR family transcriptional regulator, cyclic AMP receptor protein
MASPAAPGVALRAASLFDIDAELAERLDERQRARARSHAIVPILDLPPGPWSPSELGDAAVRPFALMIADGLVLRELLLCASTATELVGPGDVVALAPSDDALLPAEAEWSVPRAARVAVLDDRLMQIMRTWPGVGRMLLERAARREARLSIHRAIAQLPRVDQRLLAFFAHLAERWGRVGANGVLVPLHLTHETLGRLIGARRPTVSLALKDLAADGMLLRREDGAWMLGYEALERLGGSAAIPRGWQAAEARPVPVDDAAPEPSPSPGVRPADIDALRARVQRLRDGHGDRVTHSEAVLERSRQARRLRSVTPRDA